MIEHWRELLYPLGFISSLAFGARFIVQWIKSEIRKKSVVTSSFWKFSLAGNILLFIHSVIQLQFHVCLIQAINGVISWRNLNLMKPAHKHVKRKFVFILLIATLTLTPLLFIFQNLLMAPQDSSWFRVPNHSWNSENFSISYAWHLFGFIGLVLFNSRFWIQWWYTEKTQSSHLGFSFWWISLVGTFFLLIYFILIHDPVNLVGPAIGIIPYIRNLVLISKTKALKTVPDTQ